MRQLKKPTHTKMIFLGINFHLNQLIMLQSLSQELYVRMLLSVLRLKDAQGKKQNQTLMSVEIKNGLIKIVKRQKRVNSYFEKFKQIP